MKGSTLSTQYSSGNFQLFTLNIWKSMALYTFKIGKLPFARKGFSNLLKLHNSMKSSHQEKKRIKHLFRFYPTNLIDIYSGAFIWTFIQIYTSMQCPNMGKQRSSIIFVCKLNLVYFHLNISEIKFLWNRSYFKAKHNILIMVNLLCLS